MIKIVDIRVEKGRITFGCPECETPDVFPKESIQKITRRNVALTCPKCGGIVACTMPIVKAVVSQLISEHPTLKNPLVSEEGMEGKEIGPPDDDIRLGGDLILLVDYEETYREPIRVVFSDVARVDAFGGMAGAADYIREKKDELMLVIMDCELGDGTCFDVLDEIRKDPAVSKIPVIVVCADEGHTEKMKGRLSFYTQVKFFFKKSDLIRKLKEFSSILAKGKGK
jgi:CheY-like chemotaxis protein